MSLAILLAAAAIGRSQDHSSPPAEAGPDFASLLGMIGVSDDDLADLAAIEADIDSRQAALIGRILYRLEQLDLDQLDVQASRSGGEHAERPGETGDFPAGALVGYRGTAISAEKLSLPSGADPKPATLYRCRIDMAAGGPLVVFSADVPKAWLTADRAAEMSEPVALRGVLLRSASDAASEPAVVLTNRFQWFPNKGVPAGTLWLASRGFDAALLDDVRQGRPLAKPDESREAAAFYRMLDELAAASPKELTHLACEAVAEAAANWASRAKSAGREADRLADRLKTSSGEDREALQRRAAALRREQSMAANVAERAEHGLSSVWPMFLEPEESAGQFFVIEGVARRAVRILADQPLAGLTHYYELDVFPPDSQNLPVVCCVARLPRGFPTGDVIREPVQVAGVFFKRWAYARRPGADSTSDRRLPARLAPPLVLAAEPVWLPRAAPGDAGRGLWAGAMLLVAIGVSGLLFARRARRDRLARRQRARYDAPLDDLARLP
ncbi:MAG: hypothetical protein DCC67_10170 [Planctomycetota bacterium]|nr:MAG: hypothetical protein DCC67_10170 [Planctomycetota bacterium]